jgi:Transcriptional regulator, AbiEi antitoxin/Protein of unknown function (DUF559)
VLAESQHGLVARRQLLSLGFTTSAVEHRLASGRLHPVARGVYAVGWPRLTPMRRWMAAALACGDDAALSHRSAGALWGITADRGPRVDVSVPRRLRGNRRFWIGAKDRPDWIWVRCRPALSAAARTTHHGIPVTTPLRTLLDLTTEFDEMELERAINEADKRDLISPVELRAALAGYAREPGVRALRRLLGRDTFQLSDSDPEILFRPIAAAADLPPPLSKQIVDGFEVDFHWPDLGLIVETDGLRYHRTPSAQARDQIRDQAHVAAGLVALRFTHRQVKYEPAYVVEILTRTARRLRP